MSDIMRPIPFSQLMNWIIEEHKTQGAVFGVRKMVTTNQEGALPIFDERIETPFGPAAGPNTQLAQNIVASYVAGSRFFELKTVQVMDGEELSKCVNKPCIVAQDECYNCEWSTELEVPQAFAEYVKAWFACHLIAREYGLGSPDGFVFNMSVGYDLEGIKSPKVDAYIEGMKDASGSDVWNECRAWALANLDKFEHVDAAFVESIPARVSNSITESTLHGCPPAEIERIATYLITEKGLNTYIKCNPTLLGYEFARQRLNELGFDYIVFDDTHFREDLQWADAVPMFERLIALCAERGLEFGVKLTNTFPVDVTRNELPSTEMYMSGRSLFSLTIEAARRITEQFDGKLRISYSGGATVYNIRALYDAGIWPVTIFEARDSLGGVVRHVIPEFRIASDDISHDAELCLAFGAKVQLNARVESIEELKARGFTDVVVATGAWMPGSAGLGEGAELDVLEFLEAAKKGEKLELGEDVVVIGAGNTAMDAARVAKRLAGVKNVRLVYRRTKKQMPADEEELDLALADGVEFCELLAPKALNGAVLTCDVMELGEPDASGRRSPVATGETVELSATTVICAVGEGIDASLYDAAGVEHDRRGRLAATSTGVEGVWAAGDCRRGPATVVEAIADAAEVARAIAGVDFNKYADCNEQTGREDTCYERKGSLCRDKRNCTKTRCLGCGSVCEVCCDVCPNRANVAIKVPGLAKHQVVHVDGMCNECGNCAVFCPYQEGRPYKDKLTLFWSEEDMENSENEGFLAVDEDHFKVRVAGTVRTVSVDAVNTGLPEAVRLTIRAVRDNYSYLLKK